MQGGSPCIGAGRYEGDRGALPFDTYVEEENMPDVVNLVGNYPNPFNSYTIIRYSMAVESNVVIEVYNLLGQEVTTLINKEQQIGYHKITWNPKTLPSGVYFYKIKAGDYTETEKMMYLK